MVFALGGCNDSDSDAPIKDSPPVLVLEKTLIVEERVTVELKVNATDNNGISNYLWKQKSGVPVTLLTPEKSIASFTSPSILLSEGEKILVFEINVTDSDGLISQSEVQVKVQPNSYTPIVTVVPKISNKSGAFTSLNWQINKSEPIAKVILNPDDSQEYNIEVIDNTSATFNVPLAFTDNVDTSFTLTIEDEDGNSISKKIIVTGETVSSDFAQPILIYEQDNTIDRVSNELMQLSIFSSSMPQQVMTYLHGKLIPNNDFKLALHPSHTKSFVDFNQDGFIDAISIVEIDETEFDYCESIYESNFDFIIELGNTGGFTEAETMHSFGCVSIIPEARHSVGRSFDKEGASDFMMLNSKDINNDDKLDLFIFGQWYLYHNNTDSYEFNAKYNSNYSTAILSDYRLDKGFLDINSDLKTDIIKVHEPQECENIFDGICNSLVWAEKTEVNEYADYVTLDSEIGIYDSLSMADVNHDGKNNLIAKFTSNDLLSKTKWYIIEDGSVQMKSIEEISDFIDLYGKGAPYFTDINLTQETLTLYEYNQTRQQPTIKEVQKLASYGLSYQGHILHDIDQDGDLDIITWRDNKAYLIENIAN